MRLEFLITEYSKKHTNEKAVDYFDEHKREVRMN